MMTHFFCFFTQLPVSRLTTCTRTTGCAMYKLDFSLSVRCIVSCNTWLLSATSSAHTPALVPATGSSSSHSVSSMEYHKTNRLNYLGRCQLLLFVMHHNQCTAVHTLVIFKLIVPQKQTTYKNCRMTITYKQTNCNVFNLSDPLTDFVTTA